MGNIDQQLIKNQNKWAAIDRAHTRIIATSKNLSFLYKTLEKNKVKDVEIIFVPNLAHIYSPHAN